MILLKINKSEVNAALGYLIHNEDDLNEVQKVIDNKTQAQLRKVAEWLKTCEVGSDSNNYHTLLIDDEDWQTLLKEAGLK